MSDYVKMYENPRFKHERQEAERLENNLRNEATYEHGVARWKSNGSVIPEDCALLAAHLGLPIDLAKTTETRDEEDAKFFAEYRKSNANRKLSAEEHFEMEAAFGKGATVVDVITGRKYKL